MLFYTLDITRFRLLEFDSSKTYISVAIFFLINFSFPLDKIDHSFYLPDNHMYKDRSVDRLLLRPPYIADTPPRISKHVSLYVHHFFNNRRTK